MNVQQQAKMLIMFHGEQDAYGIARFKYLNERKQATRQYWKEVMEEIKNNLK